MIANIFNIVTNECIDTFDFDSFDQLNSFLKHRGYMNEHYYCKVYFGGTW